MKLENLAKDIQEWLIATAQITASCPNCDWDGGMVIIWKHGNVVEQLATFLRDKGVRCAREVALECVELIHDTAWSRDNVPEDVISLIQTYAERLGKGESESRCADPDIHPPYCHCAEGVELPKGESDA